MNKFAFPDNCTLVRWVDVDQDNRARKEYGDVEELAESIMKVGLIHPPTVSRSSEGRPYKLIGGGRRLAAMRMLECDQFPVLVREELDEHQIRELELVENFARKEMTWQERTVLISRTHRLKVMASAKDSKSWGHRETGALLGCSNAHVSHCTQVANYIIDGDKEICEAKSLVQAYEILLKRREDQAIALQASMLGISDPNDTDTVGFMVDDPLKDLDTDLEPRHDVRIVNSEELDSLITEPAMTGMLGETRFALSKMLIKGDCLEILSGQEETVDHIITDPPYGVDLGNMDRVKNIDEMVETHQREDNLQLLENFIPLAYKALRDNGYFIMWFDFEHAEKIRDMATKAGFKVQRWPLVWHKLHSCLNNAPTYNFTKTVEFALVCRKGRATLNTPQQSCVVQADGSAERKHYGNPFAKPAAVWKFILEAVAYRGQRICDPFAGEMSCLRSVINLGMIPYGIELDENRYNRGVVAIKQMLTDLTGGRAQFE